jgi:hypothetical protein
MIHSKKKKEKECGSKDVKTRGVEEALHLVVPSNLLRPFPHPLLLAPSQGPFLPSHEK